MKWLALIALPLYLNANELPTFRYSLPSEPASLDPAKLRASDADQFLSVLFSGLYRYTSSGQLVLEGAASCHRTRLTLTCELRPEHRWSTGRRVTAEDYVRAFQHLVNPQTKSFRADLLNSLENAPAIFKGELPPTQLGVRAVKPFSIQFKFATDDFDFEYKLTNVALSPMPKEEEHQAINSAYQIKSRKPGQSILLEPNPHYPQRKGQVRPPVEVLFVADDEAALALYEKKQLSMVRRLGTSHIPAFKDRKDFVQVPVTRFDYVGFSPSLKNEPDLREALSLSLDFDELQKLLNSSGKPGCPSFPERYMDKPVCLKMDLERAKKALARVSPERLKKPLRVEFSQLGGADHKRAFTWAQAQWEKNLGLKVEVQAQEQRVFLSRLRQGFAPLFRKGVALERPTCLAALEIFLSKAPENLIGLTDSVYEQIVAQLQKMRPLDQRYRKLCRQGVERLLESFQIIPLGHFQFTMLIDPRFQGWEINELNTLELNELNLSPSP